MEYSDIVAVLRDVQKNNSKEWYIQQKEIFRQIHMVLSDLYFAVGNSLYEKVDIDINPKKSISRPYNDQRFGYKPYLRDNLWITFQSNANLGPAFFIEFSPYGIRIGMGYYSATPAQMRDLRMKIDDNSQGFSDVLDKVMLDKDIQMMGEQYKKRFASNYEGLLGEIYNYRSIYFQKIIPENDLESLEQISKDTFFKLVPIYKLLVS